MQSHSLPFIMPRFLKRGSLLTIVPYKSCNFIVTHSKKYDMATAATSKVICSLILFPIAFLIEALLLHTFFGSVVSIPFAILIIPLSYFTLFFREWLYEGGWGIPVSLGKLRKNFQFQKSQQLEEQSDRIKGLVDDLAAQLDQQTEDYGQTQE